MRLILRSLLIAYLSIWVSQKVVGGLSFGGNETRTIILVSIAIATLNIFIIPLFRILSLPHFGFGFLFLGFILTFITIYVLTLFIPNFEIISTELAQLRIFGFVLPSKELSAMWAGIYSALAISLVYHFVEWLEDRR